MPLVLFTQVSLCYINWFTEIILLNCLQLSNNILVTLMCIIIIPLVVKSCVFDLYKVCVRYSVCVCVCGCVCACVCVCVCVCVHIYFIHSNESHQVISLCWLLVVGYWLL